MFKVDTDEEALANEDDSYFKSSPPIASNSLRKLAILCDKGNTRIFHFICRHGNTVRQFRLVGDEVTREAFNKEGNQTPIESFHSTDLDKNNIGGLVVFGSDNNDAWIDKRTRSMHDTAIEKARLKNIALATNECSADMLLTSIGEALEERRKDLIPSFYMNGGRKVDTSEDSRTLNALKDSVRGIESLSGNKMGNKKVSFRLFDSGMLDEDSSVSVSSASC